MATATVIASLALDLPADAGSANFVRWKLEQSHAITGTTGSALQIQVDPDDDISGDDTEVVLGILAAAQNCTADAGTDKITLAAHGFTAGAVVIFGGTAVPSPLVAGDRYFVRDAATNDFKVAATQGGTVIDLGTAGTAVTVRRLSAASTTEPYGSPGVPVIIRQPGGVLDFARLRALHVTLCARDAALAASAAIRVTAGDPTDDYTFANLPLVLAHTGGDPGNWPSALLQIPAGLAFDPAYPLRLEIRAGDANANARVLIQALGE